MNNIEIRAAISNAKLKYWQVADALSLSDGSFSRKLRKELTAEEKETVLQAIRRLKEEAV